MRKLIPILSLGLFAACVSLSFGGLNTASACPSTNSASLTQQAVACTGADRRFSFGATGEWHTTGTPFLGAVQLGTSATFNVNSIEIVPAYFFPSSCEGSLLHQIRGLLDPDPVTIGGVELTFDVGPSPYNAHSGNFTTICYLCDPSCL